MSLLKKLAASATGAALTVSVPLLANAYEQGENIYLNPAYGIQNFDSTKNLSNENLWSLGLEYRYGKNWASEISITDSDPEIKNSSTDLDLRQYGLDGIYYINTDNARLQPYSKIGIGHADYSRGSYGNTETHGRVGVGMRYFITERWSAKADAKLLYGFDDDTRDSIVSLGISYAFNGKASSPAAPAVAEPVDGDLDRDGVADSKDQCPNTPSGASVDANGCAIDSDNDGVADYRDECPDTPAGREVDEKGCKYVLTSTEEVTLNVVFPTNSSVVGEGSMGEIEEVADFMKKYGAVSSVIEGHTDDTGAAAYNESLSQRRADAVMAVLVERFGVDASRLTAKGYGEAQPIADNATKEGRQTNRRVVAVMKAEVSE